MRCSGCSGDSLEDETLYLKETRWRDSLGAGRTFATPEAAERYAEGVLQRAGLGSLWSGAVVVRFSEKWHESSSFLDRDGGWHPVIELGQGMRDQLTLLHELAHGIARRRTMREGLPKGHVGHGEPFETAFEALLRQEMPAHGRAMAAA